MHTKIKTEHIHLLVGKAVKAPSGHNTQPWLLDFRDNVIEIHPDYQKRLPVVDPHDRELFISLGCAAANICAAAHGIGYGAKVDITAEGIIHIELRIDDGPVCDPASLEIIDRRQTNRNLYNGMTIPDDDISQLRAAGGAGFYIWAKGSEGFEIAGEYVLRGNIRQMNDRAFRKELLSWMRFGRKQVETLRDGLSYEVFGAPGLPPWICRPIVRSVLSGRSQNRSDLKRIGSSSHIALFSLRQNNKREWVELGMRLEGFILKATELGIAHSYLNQPCEVASLSHELADSLGLGGELPVILLRLGYAPENAPYSCRKRVQDVII